ncbi:SEP domain-containing protein [Mycena galopus ATCC 62051]|nr:SEP domain-containing protein [Mycena galopus ATCC 62051]
MARIGTGRLLLAAKVDAAPVPAFAASSAYVPGEREEVGDDLAIRRLTFWRDGFTVENGPLMRYDDPANAGVLAGIHAGHAPPSILNVRHRQRVDVQVTQRASDDYPPPPQPFSGSGNRLGAPVPFPPPPQSPLRRRLQVVQAPTTSVQICVADRTHIVCRMNLTHTVRDLRNLIDDARPENLTRYYIIGTTFPNRTLDDNAASIKEAGVWREDRRDGEKGGRKREREWAWQRKKKF